MTVSNKVERVNNYATDALERILGNYSLKGYALVSTEMAYNKNGSMVMYLFFTKETN